MKAKFILLALTGLAASVPAVAKVADSLIAPGATLVKVSGQFSFTEGPAADRKGNIYFTDQPNDRIWKYDTEGKLSLFMEKTGRSNGLYIDRKGNILACADEKNELWRIGMDKKVTVLLDNYQGLKLNGPNDLWEDKSGGIYFTDPYYQRPYWERKKADIAGMHVYYLPAGASQPVVVANDLVQPNGIIGSADGRYLYVADIRDNKTYRYRIGPDRMLSEKTLLISQGSDGMTLDHKGNIYLTGNGVTVYDRNGTLIGKIAVPSRWTANVCFGGKKRDVLFITASESVYTLKMDVRGVK